MSSDSTSIYQNRFGLFFVTIRLWIRFFLASLVFYLLSFFFPLSAQNSSDFSNSYIASMGYVSAPLDSYLNPASLSLNSSQRMTFSYENHFCLSELSTYTMAYQQPLPWVDVGALISYTGYADFNEIRGGINVSKQLKTNLSLGIRLLFYHLDYIDNQHAIVAFTGDIGLQYQFVDNLLVGILLTNPFRVSFKEEQAEYYLPVQMQFGIKYTLSECCYLASEIQKDSRLPVCLRAGLSYQPYSKLELRTGFLTSPFMPTLGIGLQFAHFRLNIASAYHLQLGFSPIIDLIYIIR